MPIITSSYRAKGPFKNGHFSTIYSAKLRPVPKLAQHRKRLELTDGDFVDIDWSYHISASHPSTKVAILLHGLEGNAQRVYITGQGKMLIKNGWDVAALNYRGCSGEENRLYISYHSGRTEDVEELINHIISQYNYDTIALIGFSLGGNLVLKYLGERSVVPKTVKMGIAVSTPIHLRSSLERLIQFENFPYNMTFINDLRNKYRRKMPFFPDEMSKEQLKKVKTLLDFDQLYTAPAHGFKDAYDYYEKNSSLQFIPSIQTPVLILNAENDSFLSPECYPVDIAKNHNSVFLEMPKTGGHVGFHINNKIYYSEQRVVDFLEDML